MVFALFTLGAFSAMFLAGMGGVCAYTRCCYDYDDDDYSDAATKAAIKPNAHARTWLLDDNRVKAPIPAVYTKRVVT